MLDSTARESKCGSATLFVGNISLFCTESDFEALFEKFCPDVETTLVRDPKSNKNLSYGFARFGSRARASQALAATDGTLLQGRAVSVQWSSNKTSEMKEDANKVNYIPVHVHYSHDDKDVVVNEQQLRTLFTKYGTVEDIIIKSSTAILRKQGRQSGYGFVHFNNNEEGMQSAVQVVKIFQNHTVDGITFNCSLGKRFQTMQNASVGAENGRKFNSNVEPSSSEAVPIDPANNHSQPVVFGNPMTGLDPSSMHGVEKSRFPAASQVPCVPSLSYGSLQPNHAIQSASASSAVSTAMVSPAVWNVSMAQPIISHTTFVAPPPSYYTSMSPPYADPHLMAAPAIAPPQVSARLSPLAAQYNQQSYPQPFTPVAGHLPSQYITHPQQHQDISLSVQAPLPIMTLPLVAHGMSRPPYDHPQGVMPEPQQLTASLHGGVISPLHSVTSTYNVCQMHLHQHHQQYPFNNTQQTIMSPQSQMAYPAPVRTIQQSVALSADVNTLPSQTQNLGGAVFSEARMHASCSKYGHGVYRHPLDLSAPRTNANYKNTNPRRQRWQPPPVAVDETSRCYSHPPATTVTMQESPMFRNKHYTPPKVSPPVTEESLNNKENGAMTGERIA